MKLFTNTERTAPVPTGFFEQSFEDGDDGEEDDGIFAEPILQIRGAYLAYSQYFLHNLTRPGSSKNT